MSQTVIDPLEGETLVQILDQQEDYSFGSIFRVNKAKLRFRRFDGRMSEEITRINFERGDSVGILLYDPEEDVVVLIRQFRYPIYASIDPKELKVGNAKKAWMLEIVAGIIDPGHRAAEIASKEIMEESGYAVLGDLLPITTINPSPGGSSERIYLYLGLINHQNQLAEENESPSIGEDIQVVKLTFQEAMTMVEHGEISDAKTIISLQHLALIKSRGVDLITG